MARSANPLLFGLLANMTIEDLAERAGLTVRTIRNYRDKQLIDPPKRNGRRSLYSPHHVEQLLSIKSRLKEGITLAEIAVGIHLHHKARGAAPNAKEIGVERLIRVIPVVAGICVHVEDALDPFQRRVLKQLRLFIKETQSRRDAVSSSNRRAQPHRNTSK